MVAAKCLPDDTAVLFHAAFPPGTQLVTAVVRLTGGGGV